MTTQQLMKDALRAQVDKLLKANNTVTTLELKVELRKTDPEFYWNQATVSQMMDELYQNGTLVYTDNGVYRIYSKNPNLSASQTTVGITGVPATNITGTTAIVKVTPTPSTKVVTSKPTVKRISRTKALELIKNSRGHFFKAVFTKKKDGKERVLNAQYTKDLGVSPLGLVRVKEASLLKQFKKEGTLANIPSKSVIRSFNINNLKALGIGGETYKVTN